MTADCFRVRAADVSDRPAVLTVLRDAFGREDEARLVETLWAANAIDPDFVAEDDGAVIGYCAFSPVTAEPPLERPLLGLAPVAVAAERQRRGVGKALVERGLKACRANGAAMIVVLGEPEYYRRFGFVPASGANVAWTAMDAGDAFQLMDFADVADGAPRKIDYHPAFSEL